MKVIETCAMKKALCITTSRHHLDYVSINWNIVFTVTPNKEI